MRGSVNTRSTTRIGLHEVVIGQLAPCFLGVARHFGPFALDLIPVHRFSFPRFADFRVALQS